MRVLEDGERVINREESYEDHYSLVSKVAVRDGTGTVQGLIGLTRNVTSLKRNEIRLVRQNERLRSFSSVLAHDVRNPL